jgi:hypothetical protein
MDLQIERLSAEEIAALDGQMQIVLLAEIAAELSAIGKASKMARFIRTDAKKSLNRNPKDIDSKDTLLDAELVLLDLADRAKTLRDLKSIMQTILRGTPV